MSKTSGKKVADFQVLKEEQTLKLHYHPTITRTNLREFINDCEERAKMLEKDDPERISVLQVMNLYEDCLTIVEWALTKMNPLKDEKKEC